MSSGNDSDNGIGIAYTTNEEYPNHLNRNDIRSLSTSNPVEYLEFVAAQEQYAPRNLSLHQDSLLLKQQTLTNKNNNYNPYFPPTEQQMRQLYDNKHLSPLDEVVHNNPYPESYQVEMINDDNYQQPSQFGYRQSRQFQQQLPQQLPNN